MTLSHTRPPCQLPAACPWLPSQPGTHAVTERAARLHSSNKRSIASPCALSALPSHFAACVMPVRRVFVPAVRAELDSVLAERPPADRAFFDLFEAVNAFEQVVLTWCSSLAGAPPACALGLVSGAWASPVARGVLM